MQAAGGAEDGDAGGVDALTQQQDEIQRRLTAFEDMVAAEEQAADRARQVEIENLTLAVNSAEKLGLKGDDIAAAEALLRDLRAADDLGGGGTHLDSTSADAARRGAELEALHTGSLQQVEDKTERATLGVGDAFQLVLPANPEDGFIYRLRDHEYDHRILGVIETKEKIESSTEGLVKVSWKAIGLAGGKTDFVIEFGVPWQGMEPLVYIEVTVEGPPPPEKPGGAAGALGPTAAATASRREAAARVTAVSDEALAALEAEGKAAEAAAQQLTAEQDAELAELRAGLADALRRKAAMEQAADEAAGGGAPAGSMTPRVEGGGGGGAEAPEPAPEVCGAGDPQLWSTEELSGWLRGEMRLGAPTAHCTRPAESLRAGRACGGRRGGCGGAVGGGRWERGCGDGQRRLEGARRIRTPRSGPF